MCSKNLNPDFRQDDNKDLMNPILKTFNFIKEYIVLLGKNVVTSLLSLKAVKKYCVEKFGCKQFGRIRQEDKQPRKRKVPTIYQVSLVTIKSRSSCISKYA